MTAQTDRGPVTVHECPGWVFLRRHGESHCPPHRVRHEAYALALAVERLEATLQTNRGRAAAVLDEIIRRAEERA